MRGSLCARLQDGEIREAVRLTCHADGYSGYVQLKRTDASTTVLSIVSRMLPTERRAGSFHALSLLHDLAPFRLWMGMGQFFGFVEQGQEHQLAMPLMRHAALLFRRRLSKGKWARGNRRSLS
jgi:hypothetical protein